MVGMTGIWHGGMIRMDMPLPLSAREGGPSSCAPIRAEMIMRLARPSAYSVALGRVLLSTRPRMLSPPGPPRGTLSFRDPLAPAAAPSHPPVPGSGLGPHQRRIPPGSGRGPPPSPVITPGADRGGRCTQRGCRSLFELRDASRTAAPGLPLFITAVPGRALGQ